MRYLTIGTDRRKKVSTLTSLVRSGKRKIIHTTSKLTEDQRTPRDLRVGTQQQKDGAPTNKGQAEMQTAEQEPRHA